MITLSRWVIFGVALALVAGCTSTPTAARSAPNPCRVFTSGQASSVLGQTVGCSLTVTRAVGSSFKASYPAVSSDRPQQPLQVLIEVEGEGAVSSSKAQQQLANPPGSTPIEVAGQTTYWTQTKTLDWELDGSKHGYVVSVSVSNAAEQSQAIRAMTVILGRL